MNSNLLMTESLRAAPHGPALAEIMAAALRAADPAIAVRQHLRRDGDTIVVGGRAYPGVRRVVLVGAGKAGAPMAHAAAEIVGDAVGAGLVIVKEGHLGEPLDPRVEIVEAAHPVPDERGAQAAARMAELLGGLREGDLALVLISGGGSALSTWPAPGLTLAHLQAMTAALLRCGAPIGAINALRKHTTRLFGGQLARLAQPAQVAALIVSDVIGSPLDVIGSGPTAPDPTTYADAWAIVQRYELADQLPAELTEHLRRGLAGGLPETPKPGEALWARVHNTVIASNAVAAQAALAAARERGWRAQVLTTYLEGEAREIGKVAAALAREQAQLGAPDRPALMICGGETTVTIRGDGLGGRNQELALGAVAGLAGLPGALVVALATDGGDGPTDAAGAVASGDTLARAGALGLAPDEFLRRNDAYHFFAPLGDLLRPGPTLTNVNDLLFVAAA